MLETSHGFVPWDDAHHPELSQTDGVPDGRWIFINGNNTPAGRADRPEQLRDHGDHRDPEPRPGTTARRSSPRTPSIWSPRHASAFPVPNRDMSIEEYRGNFKGTLSFVTANDPGNMEIRLPDPDAGLRLRSGPLREGPLRGLDVLHLVQLRGRAHPPRDQRLAEGQGLHRGRRLSARRSVHRGRRRPDDARALYAQPHGTTRRRPRSPRCGPACA